MVNIKKLSRDVVGHYGLTRTDYLFDSKTEQFDPRDCVFYKIYELGKWDALVAYGELSKKAEAIDSRVLDLREAELYIKAHRMGTKKFFTKLVKD